uniref:Uncharacterized protein n=1 Tax=Medicago truncatula TaxID=3880 RepID=I3SP00_MEDTR|nr:unknown [Medicago truncatula]
MLPQTLAVLIMLPRRAGIITLDACFVPRKTPTKLTLITSSNSDNLYSSIFVLFAPTMPALLNMMSSLPYMEIVVFTAFSMSFSFVTSQWT